jgi:hypothetical protein
MKRYCSIFVLLLTGNVLLAQSGLFFPNRPENFSPIVAATPDSVVNHAFLPQIGERTKALKSSREQRSWLNRALFHHHFLTLDTGEVYITVDPVLNGEVGIDAASKNQGAVSRDWYYTNTRGVLVQGSLTARFGFQSALYENQSVFVDYLTEYVAENGVVPGQGRVKPFKEGVDYAMSSGSVYYMVSPKLVLYAGHGKHFIGHGYRSMILSDNSFNYPFFRADMQLAGGKLNYTWMVASLQELYRLQVSTGSEPPFLRKTMNVHHLSWAVTPRLRVGMVETMLFQSTDTLGKSQFQGQSINPVPGINTIKNGLSGAENGMLAMLLSSRIAKRLWLYGQFAWDNSKLTANAWQAGLRYRRSDRAIFCFEVNGADRNTYSGSDAFNGYVHYNQPLAHPASNGFNELLGRMFLRHRRWFTEAQMNYIDYTTPPAVPAVYGAYLENADVVHQQLGVGWVMNPLSGMHIRTGINNRTNVLNLLNNTTYIYFGIRSNFGRSYYDI